MQEMSVYSGNQMEAASATTEMMISRQAQEVQAAMVIAKRFPRDETASINRIMQSCKRKTLAERAMYEYPRGGENVTGPSIRLAEAMAQNWGNLDFGIIELDQKAGESTVMSYCWDLETNTRQAKVFTVPHIRVSKKGATPLTDPRDIYEMVANQGARRLRACILGIIPGDIVDKAVEECRKTLSGGKEPLIDRIRKMISVFQEEFGVPKECLEKYIGCKAEAFSEQSIVRLRGVFNSIREGRANRESYFELPAAVIDADTGEVKDESATEEEPIANATDTAASADGKQVSLDDL